MHESNYCNELNCFVTRCFLSNCNSLHITSYKACNALYYFVTLKVTYYVMRYICNALPPTLLPLYVHTAVVVVIIL